MRHSSHPLASRSPYSLPVNHRCELVRRLLSPSAKTQSSHDEFARESAVALVEAALFLADEPLPLRRLATLAGLRDVPTTRAALDKLRELYDKSGCGFQAEELAGGWQLLTRAEFQPWVGRLRTQSSWQLSPAARETLTIVAYRQPVTRADIEAIRGVGSNDIIKQLMEKGLVRLAGRDDSLGRPTLYETTKKFLQLCGLRSIKELPKIEEGG